MAFSKIISTVGATLKRHLLLTNTITCGGLLAVGDAITQKLENSGHDPATFKYDWPRTGRMFTVGLLMGPFNHAWYTFLDKMLVGNSGKIVLKKICCDQMVAAPYFCTTFLMGMSLLEGKGWSVSFKEWKEKFLVIYCMDWFIWPPSQAINFYFLPTEYRVLYVCFITLIWDTLLSYIKHKEQAEAKYKVLEESKTLAVEPAESSCDDISQEKALVEEIMAPVPVVEIIAPVVEIIAPVEEIIAPVEEIMAPVPVVEIIAPVVEIMAPVEETTALIEDTTALIEDTTALIEDTTALIEETKAPVPIEETPVPAPA